MADVIVVPASVKARVDPSPTYDNSPVQGIAGEALDAGKVVYLTSDGKWKLAKASSDASTLESAVRGITLNRAYGDGCPVSVMGPGGNLDLGVNLTVGNALYLSVNYGMIAALRGDLVTGNFLYKIGDVTELRNLRLDIRAVVDGALP